MEIRNHAIASSQGTEQVSGRKDNDRSGNPRHGGSQVDHGIKNLGLIVMPPTYSDS